MSGVTITNSEGSRTIDLEPVLQFMQRLTIEVKTRESVKNCAWYLEAVEKMSVDQLHYLINDLVAEYEKMTDLCRSFGQRALGINPFGEFRDLPPEQVLGLIQKLGQRPETGPVQVRKPLLSP